MCCLLDIFSLYLVTPCARAGWGLFTGGGRDTEKGMRRSKYGGSGHNKAEDVDLCIANDPREAWSGSSRKLKLGPVPPPHPPPTPFGLIDPYPCDYDFFACQVSEVRVVHKGSGYSSTLPAKVTIDPPPPRVSKFALLLCTACCARAGIYTVGGGNTTLCSTLRGNALCTLGTIAVTRNVSFPELRV